MTTGTKNLLFAYGILKNKGKVIAENVAINAEMFDLGSFPAITTLNTLSVAFGNIIEINNAELQHFDSIEGVDKYNLSEGLYRRETVYIPIVKQHVWIYLYNGVPNTSKRIHNWVGRKL
jgi:gamma-glutamylcyclotransferase (GGCT)/AIG2-like uncharacterized protein YtfP